MTGVDIAVAGCGVAGMASALLLSRQGHRVTIFERFDEARPVGSGLLIQPTGQAVLARLGLLAPLRATGARITGLLGKAGARTVLDVRYEWLGRDGAHGISIHRAALFSILHDALATAGVPIVGGHRIERTEAAGSGRRLIFADGRASPVFDLIVDSLGAASPISGKPAAPLAYGALWATLNMTDDVAPHLLEQRYERASKMVGVLPLGGGKVAFFWSLRGDALAAWQDAGLAQWKAQVAALWPQVRPLLDQLVAPEQLTFARYTHRTVATPASRGLIHIGDSWHSTSPQLGQGANMALLDAWALAQAIWQGGDLDACLARAVAARWTHVWLYQALSALFTPPYQGDGQLMPFLRDRVVPIFARRWPATRVQAAMVAGTFGGPLRRLGLTDQFEENPT